jgi:type VII secretion-associated serine protease mycosin
MVVCGALGLLLTAVAITPAEAATIRDGQWHLDGMRANEMWQVSTGKGVTVAVIDSGVKASHPDLQGQVLAGKNLAPDDPGDAHADYEGHGTAMASAIAGTGRSNGGTGAYGLAPDAKILPIRIPDTRPLEDQFRGSTVSNAATAEAIRFAVDSKAKIINLSVGWYYSSEKLAEAVRDAIDRGSLIFAAVGNDGNSDVQYPAGTPGVVGVAAVDRDATRSKSSQYGPQVDLAAPGVDIVTACTGKTGYCEGTGTSQASALASASAALIWSAHPTWTNNQVLRVLINTAGGPTNGDNRNDYLGYGVVRPRIALKTPGDPGPADEYPLPDLAEAAQKADASASAAAAASAAPSPASSEPEPSSTTDDKPVATAASGNDNSTLWVTLGLAAAALLGAAIAVPLLLARRRKNLTPGTPAPLMPGPPAPAAPYPSPYQPPSTGGGSGAEPFDNPYKR